MTDHLADEQARFEHEKYENELKSILSASENTGVLARVLGSMAFQIHCPQYRYLQTAEERSYGDIDLAAYGEYSKQIKEILENLGYEENLAIFVLSEGQRATFYKTSGNIRVEVFYGKLDFCHAIHWKRRLHIDSPTIPLAELLLEKMQIVNINEKDITSVIMLLLEHPLGEIEKETINIKLIAKLCAEEWGLWYTTTLNINKINKIIRGHPQLTPEQKATGESRLNELLLRMYAEPKALVWKVRDHLGDRVKWYKDIDSV